MVRLVRVSCMLKRLNSNARIEKDQEYFKPELHYCLFVARNTNSSSLMEEGERAVVLVVRSKLPRDGFERY